MANQNMQFIQDPKMDWTEDAGLHQRFKDWREEVELLMDMVLSHIRSADTKMKFVTLWAGKEARTYLSTLEEDHRDSLRAILDSLEEWTRPKSDEIAAFTHLRTLNQGNKMLSTYIQEVRRMVDLCNLCMCGRLQGQANQKLNCGWSLKHQSLPTMHIKGLQPNTE